MHGTDDPVVPVEQSRVLQETLIDQGVAVEYVEFEGEGHGFRQPEHRQREFELIESFLNSFLPE